jgi:hypothetical protein
LALQTDPKILPPTLRGINRAAGFGRTINVLMTAWLLLAALVALSAPASAAICKWIDETGRGTVPI